MDILEKPPVVPKKLAAKIAAVILLTGIFAVLLYFGVQQGEQFLQARDRAVAVEAEIVRVEESLDSDGYKQYDAIMRYSVNGREYEQKYRSFGNRYKAEDRIGTTVVTTVDPEHPEMEMHDIAVNCGMASFFAVICFSALMGAWSMRIRESYTQLWGWNRRMVARDLPREIHGRFAWDRLLLPGLLGLGLLIRHRQVHSWFLFVIDALLLLGGLVTLRNYINAMNRYRQEQYILRRDSFVSKRYVYDSDGPDHYYVTFTNGETTWESDRGKKYYDSVGPGCAVETVYLEGVKNPIMKRFSQ